MPVRSSFAFLFALLLLPGIAAGARSERPNVLLLSIDSLRRDALGCYGARLPHAPGVSPTPHLDRLAAEGVRMEEAYASSPWTLPSHVSLLTGTSPLVHGVETDLQTISESSAMLAEVLRNGGYRTAGVFSGPYLEPVWGFGRGFERYHAGYGRSIAAASALGERLTAEAEEAEEAGDAETAEELRWLRRAQSVRVGQLAAADVSSERVTSLALDEMQRMEATSSPWFLFVHYFDVHYDYVPPPPWDKRFDPHYEGGMTAQGFMTNVEIAVPDPSAPETWVRRISDRDLDHVRALYAGEAAWVDTHVGRLLERLDALGVSKRTLVIVVSDHGDEFFEHGGIGHRRNLAEEVIRIPMLLRLPGTLPAGHVEPGLVSLSDVMPTVLDVVGLPLPEVVSGWNILPLGSRVDDGGRRPLTSRLVRIYDGVMRFGETRIPIRTAVVHESFRFRSIKILRRRRWVLMPPRLPEQQREAFQGEANRQFRREELSWIDLARHPAEPDAAYSTDFSSREAHHALGVARRRYRVLRASRGEVVHDELPSAALRSKLAGLGYLEDSPAPTSVRQGFLLPLPRDRRASLPP